MDIGSLLTALVAADKGAAESNPFAPLQSAANGIGAAILQNAGNFSTKDNLIGGLLAGLASGVTGNLTDSYQDKQNSMAEQILASALKGEDISVRPTGMSPSVFSAVKNTGNLFALQSQLEAKDAARQAEAQQANTIFSKYLEDPGKTTYALQKLTGTSPMGTPGAQLNGLGDIRDLPQSAQGEAIKQQATADQSSKLQATIDDYFEKAKGISSLKAAIPGTTAANDMSGVQIGLTNMLQGLQGREMNDSARKALAPALPDWNDSKDQIEQKKSLFKQMVTALTPSTPLVSGAVQDPTNNKIDLGGSQPGAVPPGMKLQRNKVTGETRLVPQ